MFSMAVAAIMRRHRIAAAAALAAALIAPGAAAAAAAAPAAQVHRCRACLPAWAASSPARKGAPPCRAGRRLADRYGWRREKAPAVVTHRCAALGIYR